MQPFEQALSNPAVAHPQILFNRKIITLTRRQSLVGRTSRCSILLTCRLASREHCVLESGSEGLSLVELGSRNGTWVNGQRVLRRRVLANGDDIRIGSDELRVVDKPTPRLALGRQTQRMDVGAAANSWGSSPREMSGHASVLDLSEVLIETAEAPEQRPQTTQAVMAAVDELLDQAGFSRPYLTQKEAKQLAAIVDRVLGWWPDGSMSSWQRNLDSRIRAAARPATQGL